MYRKALTLLLSLALLLTVSVTAAQDDDPQNVDFFLTFVPNVQFAPLYVAIENGYTAEQNIEITIEHGDENVGVDLIAAGRIPFGMISGEQVLLARANDRPVVFVYEWFQEYPVGIVVPDTSGITDITEIAGRDVGIPGRFGATYSGLTALLAAINLTEDDISLEPIGFAAPDVVCTGRLDASVIYVNNEPLQIAQRAEDGECADISSVEVIRVADYVDLVSNGITTSEDVIAENPELVTAMVAAFDAGLTDTINNPAQAYLHSLAYVDNLPADEDFIAALEAASEAQIAFLGTDPDRDAIAQSRADLMSILEQNYSPETLIQFRVLLATIDLWDAEELGVSDLESWEITRDVLTDMALIETELDVEAAFSNDFLPAMMEEMDE